MQLNLSVYKRPDDVRKHFVVVAHLTEFLICRARDQVTYTNKN